MNASRSDARLLCDSAVNLRDETSPIPPAPQTPRTGSDLCVPAHDGNQSALVRAAKAGDESAFLELYRRSLPVLSRKVFRILQNSADAEDVVQDCMLKAYSRLNQFDERAAFSTWVVKIGINDSLMVIRKRRRARIESLDNDVDDCGPRGIPEIQDAMPSPEEHYGRSEQLVRLREAVRKLPGTMRDVIEFQQINDATVQEISNSLNLSVATVKSRLHRGRKALRKMMLDHPGALGVNYNGTTPRMVESSGGGQRASAYCP